MTHSPLSLIAAATVAMAGLLVSPLASAQSSQAGMHGGKASGGGAASKDMMAVMQEGNQQMTSMPMTGDPDVDLTMLMGMHHTSAIRMAGIELCDGKAAKTREMARKIIPSQQRETREFEAFLVGHGHPVGK